MKPLRILFFAEAVTLAHAARPIALARTLAGTDHEAFLACDARYDSFTASQVERRLPLHSISSARFLAALAKGRPVYDAATLRAYIEEDRALIRQIRPDLIIGDFRLSLSVSARLEAVPYAALTNAYWSPYYRYRSFPLPVLPMTRVLPIGVARALFRVAQPLAFPAHCRPLNTVRQEFGLASLGNDLRRVYTDADSTLYADDATMFPLDAMPASHHFLGPVLWTPPVPVPPAWDQIDTTRPTVYLTLGSSGAAAVAQRTYDAIAELDINIIAAAAGGSLRQHGRARTFAADYVPGDLAAGRSQLVICNGGSPTSQQALSAGVPVLGVAGNMDQFLNMGGVVRAGAGALVRADRIDADALRDTVAGMLADCAMHATAAASTAQHNPQQSGVKLHEFLLNCN